MKTAYLFTAMLIAAALSAAAQPPPRDAAGYGPPGDRGGPWEGDRMAPPGQRPASPLHRIMEELKDRDPARYERLQDLRISDPQAFRAEARALVHETAMEKLAQERPEIHAAVSDLDDDNRAWLLDAMVKSRIVDRVKQQERRDHRQEDRTERQQIRKMVEQYRTTDDEAERSRIRAELRGYVSARYDQRLDMRAEQVREMEEGVAKLRAALEQAEQVRETFVEEKVDQILENSGRGRVDRGGRAAQPE